MALAPLTVKDFTYRDEIRFCRMVDNHPGQDAREVIQQSKLTLNKQRLFYSWLCSSIKGVQRVAEGKIGWSRTRHKGRPPLFFELWGRLRRGDGSYIIPDVTVNMEWEKMAGKMLTSMAAEAMSLGYGSGISNQILASKNTTQARAWMNQAVQMKLVTMQADHKDELIHILREALAVTAQKDEILRIKDQQIADLYKRLEYQPDKSGTTEAA